MQFVQFVQCQTKNRKIRILLKICMQCMQFVQCQTKNKKIGIQLKICMQFLQFLQCQTIIRKIRIQLKICMQFIHPVYHNYCLVVQQMHAMQGYFYSNFISFFFLYIDGLRCMKCMQCDSTTGISVSLRDLEIVPYSTLQHLRLSLVSSQNRQVSQRGGCPISTQGSGQGFQRYTDMHRFKGVIPV